MNTTDYIVQSDILAGVISALISKMSCKGVSTANLWKPAVESIVMSILGRMWENNLTGKTFSREPEVGKPGTPYIRSEEGRSSLIIFLASIIYSYIGKKGNAYESATMNVASDVLGSQLQAALFETDTVWYAKAK